MAKKFAKYTRDRKIGDLLIRSRKYKFLALWVECFNTKQSEINISLRPLQLSIEGIKSPKKDIYNYKETGKSYRDLFYNIKKVHDEHLLQKFCSIWSQYAQKSRDTKRKIWYLQSKSGTFGSECFQTWRDKYIKRRNYRKKIDNLFSLIKRQLQSKLINRLASTYQDRIKEQAGTQKAQKLYVRNLKKRILRAWMNRIKRCLMRKKNELIAGKIYYESLVRRGFAGITSFYAAQRMAVINDQKSTLFYAFHLKRLPFFGWKRLYLKKIVLRSAVDGYQRILNKRSSPLFIQQLRLNYYLKIFKNVAIPKAIEHNEKMLRIKTFYGFKLAHNLSLQKRRNEIKAHIQYINQLLLKSLRSWLAFIISRKAKNDTRAVLYSTIQAVDNQNLLAHCFNVMKVYKEESQEYLVDLRTIMIENALRRILGFWKNHCDQKKYTKKVIQNFKTLAFENKRAVYFNK